MLLGKSSKASFDTLIAAAIQNNKALSQSASRFLHVSRLLLPLSGVWVYKQGNSVCTGNEVPQQSEALCTQQRGGKRGTRDVGVGPAKASNEAFVDGIFPNPKYDRNGVGCCFCSACRLLSTNSGEYGHRATNQFHCQRRKAIILALCPAELDDHIAGPQHNPFRRGLGERQRPKPGRNLQPSARSEILLSVPLSVVLARRAAMPPLCHRRA